MERKRIIIVSHALELGGAERALLGLLENFDTTKYEVDLFLMRHSGEMMNSIPNDIHLLPEIPQYACLAVPIIDVIKNLHLVTAFNRWRGKRAAIKRVTELDLGDNDVAIEYSHKYTLNNMPKISDKKYDVAISFLTPHYFVANKVYAKKKIAWIHTDYSKVQVDRESQIHMWEPYDSIVSISEQAAEEFKKIFPTLSSKVTTVENMLPMRYISELANAFSVSNEMPNDGRVKLLSIGRFCYAKNFDNIPDICKRLLDKGIDCTWYIIGFGGDEELIKARIKEFGVQDNVLILGKKANPYPYINACDLYVQPSRYEGKCVSVVEAQLLHKPVIISDYATSSSQLNNSVDGMIVPINNEECAVALENIIKDEKLQLRLIENTKKYDYSNSSEIYKVYQLIED